MRIACLVTVCAALTTTLCSAAVSSQTRYQAKEYRRAVEPRNSSLTSDVSHHPDDFIFLREIPSRKPRRPHQIQVFPTRQYSSRGSSRARSRRQLRRLSTRSLPISRSLDVTHNQNQIESIQAAETFDEGAIHIEPLYRVSKKKGILDSLIDILRRAVTPSKTHLGPLVGPVHVPGLGDKVYIRLLEPPDSNHLVIKVVSHVPTPHEIESPPHFPSVTTVLKNAETIPIDHHSSLLSTDVSDSPGHLPQVHATSVDLSSDGLSVFSNHHSVHPVSPMPDFLSSPSNQYRQIHQPLGLFPADNHASSSNQYQPVHHHSGSQHSDNVPSSSNQYQPVHHHSGSQHLDNVPSSSNHQYRQARPTALSSSKTVMKISKTMPTTYKPPKEFIRTSRMFKTKQKQTPNPPSSTSQTLSSTSISPTKADSVQQNVRVEGNRQPPTSTKATSISSPNPLQALRTEKQEPLFQSAHFENSDFKPFYSEQYDPSLIHHHYSPTPTVEIQDFNQNDVLRPKTTQSTLNPIFADIPSSSVTRVSRVTPVESSAPKTHVGSGQAFEMVRAPTLIPTYAPFIPHPPFILPPQMIDTLPTKFNLFTPMDEPKSKSRPEKLVKSKEVKPTWSTPNVSSRVTVPQSSSNASWDSVKMKHADQTKAEIRARKVLADATPTPKNLETFESFVTLASISPSIPPMIKGPTVIPFGNPVNKSPTILPVNSPVSKGPTIVPMTNVVTGSHNIIPLISPQPKGSSVVPLIEVPPVAKKSQGKADPKCLKCQQSKEKKVPAVVEHPRPIDSIFQEHVSSFTMGNTTPAAKVPSSSSSGTRPASSAATAKPVLISSTTKKPLPKRPKSGGNLPQKSMPNSNLKKAVISNPTRKPGLLVNTTKKSPINSSSSSSSSSTTRKPPMQASDFKKRLELWKKNRKV